MLQPGWYPDPSGARQFRWWDGRRWSDHVLRDGAALKQPVPGLTPPRRVPVWLWVVCGVGFVLVLVVAPPLLLVAAIVVLATGIVGLVRHSPTWLRLRSSRAAVGVVVASTVVVLISGGLSAALTAAVTTDESARVVAASAPPHSEVAVVTPTPTPTPTPVVTVVEEVVTEPVPFERTTTDDPNTARGQSLVIVAGIDGVRTKTYRVTLIDGVETERVLSSDVLTTAPVNEVTAIGSYDPPVAQPVQPANTGCDANYADACVPIASDVDCAWGSGDGPAYFDGVARVVGRDVYDLDRDGDGYACER